MPQRGRPRSQRSILVEQYLAANPYASNEMISKVTGAPPATITRTRNALIAQGIVPPSIHAHARAGKPAASLKSPLDSIDTEGVEEVLAKIAALKSTEGTNLTTEESLRILSALVRTAEQEGNSKLVIDATMAFHRLQDRVTAAQLGPPPPLTQEDKIDRMKVLIDVVGFSILASATHSALSAEDLSSFEEELGRLTATQTLPTLGGATVKAAHSSPEALSENTDAPQT